MPPSTSPTILRGPRRRPVGPVGGRPFRHIHGGAAAALAGNLTALAAAAATSGEADGQGGEACRRRRRAEVRQHASQGYGRPTRRACGELAQDLSGSAAWSRRPCPFEHVRAVSKAGPGYAAGMVCVANGENRSETYEYALTPGSVPYRALTRLRASPRPPAGKNAQDVRPVPVDQVHVHLAADQRAQVFR